MKIWDAVSRRKFEQMPKIDYIALDHDRFRKRVVAIIEEDNTIDIPHEDVTDEPKQLPQ
jgi:folate-dependent tRNA-U54 methylase TrmFO/GidA